MSLPPERISIKRRRQDDPVETLLFEQAPGRDKKRRATDFLFRRLLPDEIEDTNLPRLPESAKVVSGNKPEKQRSISYTDDTEIPQIRTTQPGDEISDMKALKATIKSKAIGKDSSPSNDLGTAQPDQHEEVVPSKTRSIAAPANARRFHLSRDINSSVPTKRHGGIRKSAYRPKTHLATFIEKAFTQADQHKDIRPKSHPIDRIIEEKTRGSDQNSTPENNDISEYQTQSIVKRPLNHPFVKVPANGAKTGYSLNTHPDTWDFESDQLASELEALALELDLVGENGPLAAHSQSKVFVDATDAATEEDYVYETYIRLSQNPDFQAQIEQNLFTANIGVLIIDEADEELWEAYGESDSENECDEEDADSNAEDNPANDYPEDEVSSDDELGLGAYDHRRHASDDEEYDLERDQ